MDKDLLFSRPHVNYSAVTEFSVILNSRITNLKVVHVDENYTGVTIKDIKGNGQLFVLFNSDAAQSRKHQLRINDID